jgi:hypothetical protein
MPTLSHMAVYGSDAKTSSFFDSMHSIRFVLFNDYIFTSSFVEAHRHSQINSMSVCTRKRLSELQETGVSLSHLNFYKCEQSSTIRKKMYVINFTKKNACSQSTETEWPTRALPGLRI